MLEQFYSECIVVGCRLARIWNGIMRDSVPSLLLVLHVCGGVSVFEMKYLAASR